MESLVAMVIVLLYQVRQISPCCLVARQPFIITNTVFRKGIIMLYLTIIVVNDLSLFFQIYNIEGVENKHSLFLSLDSLCGLKCVT